MMYIHFLFYEKIKVLHKCIIYIICFLFVYKLQVLLIYHVIALTLNNLQLEGYNMIINIRYTNVWESLCICI